MSRAFWIHAALFVVVAVVYTLKSTGAYHDDDLDHYFMARAAFAHPEFFLDPWGRPGFTLLYALPAQFGWTAVRLFTVLLAVVTMALTARTARRLGAESSWAAGALVAWQPLFFILSFSALTEPLAALLLALLYDAQAGERPHRAALAAGLLPLVRLELGVVSLLVGGWILLRGLDRRALLWIPLPVALWAVVGGLVHGDPLWLANSVGGAGRPLRSAGPIHTLRNVITVVGPVLFLGLLLGVAAFARRSWRPERFRPPAFAALSALLALIVLTLLSWEALPFGNSIGFLRHLIVLAPAVALVGLFGFEGVLAPSAGGASAARRALVVAIPGALFVALVLSHRIEADFFAGPGRDWSRLIGFLAATLAMRKRLSTSAARALHALVLVAAVFCGVTRRPLELNVEQKTVKAVTDYLVEERLLGRPLLANHPWIYHFTGRDRWDRATTPYVTRASLAAAPRGALALWENHYGERLYGDVPVEELRRAPGWRLLVEVESGDGQFRVAVFEKIGG
jgi:hypothetical protein